MTPAKQWLFIVLSIALAAWVERRARDAFMVMSAIHMLHNAVALGLASFATQYAATH
jgi:hypothetical protein